MTEREEEQSQAAVPQELTADVLDALIATAPVGIALVDQDMRFVRVNQHMAAMNNLPIEAHLGRSLREVVPQAAAELEAIVAQVLATGLPLPDFELDGERNQQPGERRYFRASYYPVRDRTGNVVGVGAVVADITERRRTEEHLRFLTAAETALSGSLDYATTVQTVLDLIVPRLADWCALYSLDRSGGLLRTVAPQTAAPHPFDLLAPQPDTGAAHPIIAALHGGGPLLVPELSGAALEPWVHDPEQRTALDCYGLRSALVLPLRGRERVLGVLALLSAGPHYDEEDLHLAGDLARRAAMALDNARLYRETQEAVRARDQFLSIAAHELKTPLTSLKGYVDLMVRRMDRRNSGDERERRALRVIGDQAQRLNRMITSLLDLTRIENGQLSIERAPLDLSALAQRLVEEIRPTTDRHTLHLEGAEAPLWIKGDELRLEQVLQNLIQNAIKYSPQGGNVGVWLERRGDQALLRVSDQGVGIPADALPLLFRRFYRAPNVERLQISGVGVGLFVVREIIALHGGTIEVESVEGSGSTFCVTLPLREGEADEH
ncbi:MAG: hypothetical protein OHK0022_57690 [Roseiflexaceae bacterium]